ncbi:MAG: hypothetical protein IJM84_05950 [Bacteroidaceae bacterium]|nr:hypothetical protein [Bacteroidaceae bacterium]
MSKHDIAESIRKLAGSANTFETFVCEVKSVDGATCTVTRVLDGLEIADVRLNCHITENEGIVVTPKVNSFVLVTNIDGRQHFVSQCSEVEKITIDCNGDIVINGGDNKGIVKIQELKDNLDSLKSYIEAMNTAISTGFSSVGESSAASGTAGKSAYTSAMTGRSINFKDMEDTKVTH